MDSGVILEGWLFKSPSEQPQSSAKKWHKKWFVLRRNPEGKLVLQYYEKKSKKKCKEEFNLGGNVELAFANDQFIFRIISEHKRLLVAASSQAEQDTWAQALSEELKFKYKPMHEVSQPCPMPSSPPQNESSPIVPAQAEPNSGSSEIPLASAKEQEPRGSVHSTESASTFTFLSLASHEGQEPRSSIGPHNASYPLESSRASPPSDMLVKNEAYVTSPPNVLVENDAYITSPPSNVLVDNDAYCPRSSFSSSMPAENVPLTTTPDSPSEFTSPVISSQQKEPENAIYSEVEDLAVTPSQSAAPDVATIQNVSYMSLSDTGLKSSESSSPTVPPEDALPLLPLPYGWKQRKDPSGRPYYVNEAMQLVQYRIGLRRHSIDLSEIPEKPRQTAARMPQTPPARPRQSRIENRPPHPVPFVHSPAARRRLKGIQGGEASHTQLKQSPICTAEEAKSGIYTYAHTSPQPAASRPADPLRQKSDEVQNALSSPSPPVNRRCIKAQSFDSCDYVPMLPANSERSPSKSLPSGWEQRTTLTGRPYFVHSLTETTHFEDPRTLPDGWEQTCDKRGNTCYVHTNTKTATYRDPRMCGSLDSTGPVWAELPKLKFKIRQFSVPRGNVEFCNQIGDCVFGEVWLGSVKSQSSSASDITPCVIKLLKDRRNDGGTRTDRDIGEFLREAEIMSRFDHPNVLRLLGISITQTPYLILTEYLDKRDLKHLLQRDRQRDQLWSLKMKLNCALQVAEGLQYLTVVKSFIHRDVAARNVFVRKDEHGELLCKITDFGLSRNEYESNYYRFDMDENRALLPIKWLAIESIEDQTYNHRTVVWSFGVLLWEIFAMGLMPYGGTENRVVWEKLRRGLRLSKPQDCPGPMYDLILLCTNLSPAKRPLLSMICTRLQEEMEVCNLLDKSDNSAQGTQSEKKRAAGAVQRFASKTVQLRRRLGLSDIQSVDEVNSLRKEEVEDILHSNFVPIQRCTSVETVADRLRILWLKRHCSRNSSI